MAIASVTDASFQEAAESAETVLVDFWAEWCPPCHRIAPVLEDLAQEMPDLKIVKLNADDNPDTPGRFGVMSLPTLLLFRNGQAVDRLVGFMGKEAIKARVSRQL